MIVSCTLCGEDVNTAHLGVCRKVTGWAPQRGATGGSNVTYLAERHDEYAHARCVARERDGVSARQPELGGA